MKRIICALSILLAVQSSTQAVSDTEEEPQARWKGSVSFGANLTRGNSDTTLINTKLAGDRKGSSHEFIASLSTAYGKNDDDVTDKNGEASAQYNLLLSEKVYLYVTTLASYDEIAMLDYRVTAGPGIGYYLLRQQEQELSLELGSSFMIEQFAEDDTNTADDNDDKIALRATQSYKLNISKTATLSEHIEYLSDTKDSSDYLLKIECALETAVSKAFSLRVSAIRKYDSEPVAGVEKEDLTMRASIVYQLD